MLPFAAVLVIVVKAGKMAVDSVTPLAEKLPLPKGEAVIAVYVVGALLLALVAFAAWLWHDLFQSERTQYRSLKTRS